MAWADSRGRIGGEGFDRVRPTGGVARANDQAGLAVGDNLAPHPSFVPSWLPLSCPISPFDYQTVSILIGKTRSRGDPGAQPSVSCRAHDPQRDP